MVYKLRRTNIITNLIRSVFKVSYQQEIRIVFLFNLKLNDCAELNKRARELAKKTDNLTVSGKHRKGRILAEKKKNIGECRIIRYPRGIM